MLSANALAAASSQPAGRAMTRHAGPAAGFFVCSGRPPAAILGPGAGLPGALWEQRRQPPALAHAAEQRRAIVISTWLRMW